MQRAIGIAAVLLCCVAGAQAAGVEPRIATDEIGGNVRSAARRGSRCLGDRRNPRFPDAIRQDRRDRRSRPLPDTGTAARQVPRLGARLRSRRLPRSRCNTRPAPRVGRQRRAGRGRGGQDLSGRLLVRDDEDPAGRTSRSAAGRPQRLSHVDEEHGLCRLSSARQSGDAHHSQKSRHLQVIGGGLGEALAVRTGRQPDDQHRTRRTCAEFPFTISRIGPTASPPASFRQRTPPRPSGIERNVVATVRDWSDAKAYLHDLSGTDRRNPTVNGNGLLYGTPELSTDNFPVLDPLHNLASTFKATVRDADTPSTHDDPVLGASPYWGEERIWDSPGDCAQSDARCVRTRLVHRADPRRRQSVILQEGIQSSVGKGFPPRHVGAPARGI